ncbi:N-acetylmuramidase domain-containing protein [Aureimonas leprariae]|uniref:N-acetylmuramidase family protein n=1 Tax=Plantimonas leprariae TaxID=2615207 RepID=A0A7V7TVG9_9HYPH|nr:N-acetylmuramidase domain-containing protein [Aureimonas leprariae]KAB0677982.1 N-acetylmuramidase family protein [Aureimonas leprariae]
MPDSNAIATIVEAARETETRTGVRAAVLLAVASVETNLAGSASVDGRLEPLIRFEGHWFDKLLPEAKRRQARVAGLSDPRAGAVRNPATQAGRWVLLARAAAIDAEAAYAATSWGLCQVMGFHWKRLGFPSAAALAAEARRSADGQFLIAARFLKLGNLDRMLAERRFADFAKAYNGPAFAKNRYDEKIAAAFAGAERRLLAGAAAAKPSPAIGKKTAKG